MKDDTITRVRAALARLAEVEREATPGPWFVRDTARIVHGHTVIDLDSDLDIACDSLGISGLDADAAAIVALRNAAPALLALAEAVAGLADGDEWWRYCAADFDGGTASCIGCGALRAGGFYNGHASDCPALALDAALAALADDTTGGDTMTNEPPPFTGLALDAPVTARDIAAEIGVYCDSAGENYTLRAVNPDGSPGDVLAFVPGGAAVAFALAEPYNAALADAPGEVQP